jgi:DNA polymerase (family 10)
MAKEAGVKMIINTDSHEISQLKTIDSGVYRARRGWAEKDDIINTRELDDLLIFLNNN